MRLGRVARDLNVGVQLLIEVLERNSGKPIEGGPNYNLSDDEYDILMRHFRSGRPLKDVLITELLKANPNPKPATTTLKIIGKIDLDANNMPVRVSPNMPVPPKSQQKVTPHYDDNNPNFSLDELILNSYPSEPTIINLGNFAERERMPFYSVLIGQNGAGKSRLLREIVDFFVDLATCIDESKSTAKSSSNKSNLRGVGFSVNGVSCFVMRDGKSFLAECDGKPCDLADLRLPQVVGCHFGAFDKFPRQNINSQSPSKYGTPYYQYVGAYSGNIISSSSVSFRLFYTLAQEMNERQRANVCSILGFIGYNSSVTFQYSLKQSVRKDTNIHDLIESKVKEDKGYITKEQCKQKTSELFKFYKNKTANGNYQHLIRLDFARNESDANALNEIEIVNKLWKYDIVTSVNTVFYKDGTEITSDAMSSGEFAMLATVLSISVAVGNKQTLVLLDEPELSQHPNWQMSIIDNLDKTLQGQPCHLLMATHSHLLVSDLPMNRSNVIQMERSENKLCINRLDSSTYGWSPEEVLLKVFKTATERNRYLAEVIAEFVNAISTNTIDRKQAEEKIAFIEQVCQHLSDVDPLKKIAVSIVNEYRK